MNVYKVTSICPMPLYRALLKNHRLTGCFVTPVPFLRKDGHWVSFYLLCEVDSLHELQALMPVSRIEKLGQDEFIAFDEENGGPRIFGRPF
jgi:hypothetical protein